MIKYEFKTNTSRTRKIKAKGEIDREVTTIENDSRNVVEGSMFFAIKGFTLDGTQFIPSAIEKGAKVIVVDETTDFKSLSIPEDVTLIVVPEIREVHGNLCVQFLRQSIT